MAQERNVSNITLLICSPLMQTDEAFTGNRCKHTHTHTHTHTYTHTLTIVLFHFCVYFCHCYSAVVSSFLLIVIWYMLFIQLFVSYLLIHFVSLFHDFCRLNFSWQSLVWSSTMFASIFHKKVFLQRVSPCFVWSENQLLQVGCNGLFIPLAYPNHLGQFILILDSKGGCTYYTGLYVFYL